MTKRAAKNNAPKIGDKMVHAQWDGRGAVRRVFDTTIVGETKTLWIDANGNKWHKATMAAKNQGSAAAYLMTPETFEASK